MWHDDDHYTKAIRRCLASNIQLVFQSGAWHYIVVQCIQCGLRHVTLVNLFQIDTTGVYIIVGNVLHLCDLLIQLRLNMNSLLSLDTVPFKIRPFASHFRIPV